MSKQTLDTAVTYVTTPTYVGVAGLSWLGYTIDQWVLIGTLIMIFLNFLTWWFINLPKLINLYKKFKARKKEARELPFK